MSAGTDMCYVDAAGEQNNELLDLSIIIPIYNENENVERIRRDLDAYFAGKDFSAEVVFVDDGSTDGSVEKLCAAIFEHASVKIVKLSKNFGSHAALRAGIANASADRCIFYYMDMPDPPSIIGDFYQWLGQGYDMVYGIRKGYKPSFLSGLFSKLLIHFIAPDYPKDGIGSIAFNQKIKAQLNQNIESDSSIFLQLFSMGFRKKGIECPFGKREKGVSKWTFTKKFKLLIDTFVTFSHVPIRAVSIAGLTMALMGIIWGIAILIIKLFNLIPLQLGYPTLIVVLLFGFGVTNISIGVMSEYLVRTLQAARRRPVFIVDEVLEGKSLMERQTNGRTPNEINRYEGGR